METGLDLAPRNGARPPGRRLRRPTPKPGLRTSEFWSTLAALATALAACLTAEDRWVKVAALAALTCLGCVLGGLYIWSRTRVKVRMPREERTG